MKFSKLIQATKYYSRFIPFKVNFVIYCLVLWLAYGLIHSVKSETNSFVSLTLLMAKIAMWFSLVIVIIAFLSVLISSLYFYFSQRKNNHASLNISMDAKHERKDVLVVHTKIEHALKPLLGSVSVQLFYDGFLATEKFLLTNRIKKQFIPFKGGVAGENKLLLPYIKEYFFSHGIVFFEDMLHFFSLPVQVPVNTTLLNTPHNLTHETEEYQPKKTEEEKVRIEQLRKVEGELLNYKKFEDSDDVRRIVWKIFAKNKELVVRTPEVLDPFASHIYMYASFYNSFAFNLYENYCLVMLSYFKNCVWTIYDTLAQKEYEIKYIPDQFIQSNTDNMNRVKHTITLSHWHQDTTLTDYYKPKNASILCLHSFSEPKEIEGVLSSYEKGTTVFFVQVSKALKSYYLFNWISRIFFKPPKDELSSMKSKWVLHPLKYKLHANETKIIELLRKQDINFEIL